MRAGVKEKLQLNAQLSNKPRKYNHVHTVMKILSSKYRVEFSLCELSYGPLIN